MVLVCGLGLAWVITHQPPAPALAPGVPVTQASKAPGAPDTPDQTAVPGAAPASGSPAPTPAFESFKPEILRNPAAEYTFTNLGGGIKEVKILTGPFAGRTEQIINAGANAPIGALVSSTGSYDLAAYKMTSKSDRAITYAATVNGVEITKAWTMNPGEPDQGWGYVWNLALSFKNTAGTTGGDYFLHAGVLGKLHASEILPPASNW